MSFPTKNSVLPTDKPICVTGANGFVGGFITEELLKAGYNVHGTVRDPKAKKNQFLLEVAAKYPKVKLTLFAADLSKTNDFDAAIEGCDVVVHVAASVFSHYKKDPFVEVINPSVDGVINVVSSCNKFGVRRIVYTSSVATVNCLEKNRAESNKGKPFTEDMWNTHLTPTYGTYNYSKIKAEEKLAELWKGECVSILPVWVVGPQQNNQVTSSQQVIKALINKEYKMAPPMWFHFVDVRDIARAHVFSAINSAVPNGRYMCCPTGECQSILDFSKSINKACPEINAPTKTMPWVALWAASWWDKRLSNYFLYEKCSKVAPVEVSKLKALGFTYNHTDLTEVMRDEVASFREHGITPKAEALKQ